MPQLVLSAAEKADGEALVMYLLAEAAAGDDAEAREFAEDMQEMWDSIPDLLVHTQRVLPPPPACPCHFSRSRPTCLFIA